MHQNLIPKFKFGKQTIWDHHRSGWTYVLDVIRQNFHHKGGVKFIGAVEDEIFAEKIIEEPWVGFIHQVPRHDLFFPDLERLLKSSIWERNLKTCKGLYVLSNYIMNYLRDNGVTVPINRVYYPVPQQELLFDHSLFNINKKIIHSGEFLRNYQAFFDLKAPGFKKIFLIPNEFKHSDFNIDESTTLNERVTNEEYDQLFSESIVFLNLFDAPSNTVIVECIARNTPVLVNKLAGVVEYLGEDYPFYYETLEEATKKLLDTDLIKITSTYLEASEIKPKLKDSYFIETIRKSSIYRSLPIPEEIIHELKSFDVSVVICSYKRIYNLDLILQRFTQQDYKGKFEIYLWNNNIAYQQELNQIYIKYKDRLNLRLINSTHNFYCIIRAGLASLIKSDLLLFCDDDVIPSTGYLSFFLDKYALYGEDSAICLRGHKFFPHQLNEEDPELSWENNSDIKFYDENQEDLEIHYAHADNMLIHKRHMLSISNYLTNDYNLILIDDYWFSYILLAKLGLKIWKVSGNGIMEFTECESNPDIAMYRNTYVRDKVLSFYIAHMREGWPFKVEYPNNLKS